MVLKLSPYRAFTVKNGIAALNRLAFTILEHAEKSRKRYTEFYGK
jgi:hypothetical protein